MPLLGFQSRFAPLVESGQKRQTIRAYRKDGRDPKPGDRLYLYTGLRTPYARKLGEARCTAVEAIRVERRRSHSDVAAWKREERIARADGFEHWAELLNWFERTHGLPFEGLLIRWGAIEAGR